MSQFWQSMTLKPREETWLVQGHTAHQWQSWAKNRSDFWSGAVVTRFLYLPRRSAWRWAPWIGESDWPSSPRVFYFLSCLPTIDRGEQDTPKGQKSSPPYLPTSWLHTCKPISITCLVDRGCCQLCLFFFFFFQLCLKSRDQGVRSLGTVAFSARDSC